MIGGRGGGSLVAIAFLALTQLQVVTARADLLVTNNVGSAPGNVLQFDQTTGAFERVFIPNAGSQPIDIALGPDGNLYVTSGLTSSTGNPAMLFSIRRFDARTGAVVDVFASDGPLEFPQGLAFGRDGNLYVGNQRDDVRGVNGVLRYNLSTGAFIDVFAMTGSPNVFPGLGIAFGPDGNLYLATSDNVAPGSGQVRRFDAQTGALIDIFAADPLLRDAEDLVFGPDGNLYVTSVLGGNVRRFSGTTGAPLGVFATLPTAGGAHGIAFGPDGNLYVGSNGPNEIVRFSGATGAFLDVFVPPGSGTLQAPVSLLFLNTPQVVSEPSSALLLALACALLIWGGYSRANLKPDAELRGAMRLQHSEPILLGGTTAPGP